MIDFATYVLANMSPNKLSAMKKMDFSALVSSDKSAEVSEQEV